MGLETATYIDSLVETNPTGSDDRSTADDHLRLIKASLKRTFANINGEVRATPANLNFLTAVAENVQAKLDALSVSAAATASRVASMSASMSAVEARVGALEVGSASNAARINTLSISVSIIEASVAALNSQVTSLSATFTVRTNQLSASIASAESHINAVSASLDTTSATLRARDDQLQASINALTTKTDQLSASLTTKVDLAGSQTITGEKVISSAFTRFNHSGAALSFDSDIAGDGRGIRRITCNDGRGNWNFRSGVRSDGTLLRSTNPGDGALSMVLWTDSTPGSFDFQVAPGVSTALDQTMSLINALKITAGTATFLAVPQYAADPVGANDLARKSYVDALVKSEMTTDDRSTVYPTGVNTVDVFYDDASAGIDSVLSPGDTYLVAFNMALGRSRAVRSIGVGFADGNTPQSTFFYGSSAELRVGISAVENDLKFGGSWPVTIDMTATLSPADPRFFVSIDFGVGLTASLSVVLSLSIKGPL